MKVLVDVGLLKRIYKLLESHAIGDPYIERELEKVLFKETAPKPKQKLPKPKQKLQSRTDWGKNDTPINRESAKRKIVNRERRKIVQKLREQTPGCQFPHWKHPIKCFGELEPHEPKTRGRGGSIVNEHNILLLCHNSHQWVTTHPIEANQLGLVKNSWEKE